MSREKQIEKMAKVFCSDYGKCDRCNLSNPECETPCTVYDDCEALYKAGYRKASDFARNIVAELDNALHDMAMEYHNAGHPEYFAVCEMVHHKVIRPIEKKYTEDGE